MNRTASPSPSPASYREALDAVRDRQTRENSGLHTGLAVILLTASLVLGWSGLTRVIAFTCLMGAVTMAFQSRIPMRYRRHVAHALLLALAVPVQLYLPRAVIGPAALLPIGISFFLSCRRTGCAFGLLAALLATQWLPCYAPEAMTLAPLPALAIAGAFVAFIALAGATKIERRFGEYDAAHERHCRDEVALRSEEKALARRGHELARASAELTTRRNGLEAQRARERAAAEELRLRRADERDLAQAIHHDLREPLRSIVSFSQLLDRRLADLPAAETARPMLAFVTAGGQRMATMLTDLHDYAAAGRETGGATDVALGALWDEVTADLHDAVARAGAVVETRGELPVVRGRATALRQLLLNLVGNALKFGREGVPVRVSVVAYPDEAALSCGGAGGVVVEVRDNGVGVPAAERERVFGLFHRVGATAAREGSGVGLSLCRRIAMTHGWDLECRGREPEPGAAFALRIPAEALRVPFSPAEVTAAPPAAPTATLPAD